MPQVLAVALAAMQQDMQRLDRVAFNLANVSTPGYKREVAAARPFADVLAGIAAGGAASDAGIAGLGDAGLRVLIDSRPGTLKTTGEPLDVALNGEGFFEVATDNGPAYTRQGNFKLDARGRLVTAQGDAVLGKNGDIYLAAPNPVIDGAGNISEPHAPNGAADAAPGTPVAQLKVVRFDDPERMQRLGDGLMTAGTGLAVLGDADTHLRQGALENANVNAMQEIVQMMQTVRHFESMQKVAQASDDMLGSAIQKLS